MTNSDSISIVLAARAAAYRTLQNILGNEPLADMLEDLCGEATQSVLMLFEDDHHKEYAVALKALFAVAAECREGGTEALDKLDSGFTRLFVGPGRVEANPWESSYLGNDNTVFQRNTLEVRKAYVAQGLLPQGYPHVSDDHIAIELAFLAQLAKRAEDAWTAADPAQTLNALAASETFLREHTIKWASDFSAAVSSARHAYFYREAASVLKAFLPIDLKALEDVANAITH